MRYKAKGLEIRSENAARPVAQASAYVLKWIAGREMVDHAPDYGCGKLRYSGAIAEKCRYLTLVDSSVQLDRAQRISGTRTSVRQYVASSWPHARILTPEQFAEDEQQYDLALCLNVLSAIPSEEVRSQVLFWLSTSLKPQGVCLFAAQYRNSYFKQAAASPNAIPHLDGWISKRSRSNSYYGILPKAKLEALVVGHGFEATESWVRGQSAYVLARRAPVLAR